MRFLLLFLFLPAASLPATEPARWFKGNTHTHSLWSDGDDFPEMITDWYVRHGYDFLAMSDHNVLARGEKWMSEAEIEKRRLSLGRKVLDKYRERFGAEWVETRTDASGATEVRLKKLEEYRGQFEKPGRFLLVEAEEISASFGKVPLHMNAVNVAEVIPPQKDLSSIREVLRANLQAVAEQARRTGRPIMAHINHPNFRWALMAEDLAHVIEDKFFEVFNGHQLAFPQGSPERAESASDRMWDIANTIRIRELKQPPLMGVATDDSHNYHGGEASPGRGWVMVRAEKLEANALVTAMQRGDFYATTGVLLEDVSFDPTSRRLQLKIKAAPGLRYVTEFRGTPRNHDRTVREIPAPAGDTHPVRLAYSPDVGKVLATSESLEPVYQMTGDELYVRAVVTADRRPDNPLYEGQMQQAWTQPVGW